MPLRGDKDFLTVGVEAAMATTGYDPYLTLWQFFTGHPEMVPLRGFTDAERVEWKVFLDHDVIGARDFSIPLLERFKTAMREKNGRVLYARDAPLVAGLLECLNTNSLSQIGPETHVRGIHDHFKGGVYLSLSVGPNATNDGEPMVHYISMIYGTEHFRECWQWNEVVQWPDQMYRSRFIYRGKDLRTAPPSFKVPLET